MAYVLHEMQRRKEIIMDERTVIKSKNKSFVGFMILGIAVGVILFIIPIIEVVSRPLWRGESLSYNLAHTSSDEIYWSIALVIVALVLIIYFMVAKSEITVTDKRVYGRTAFGKRVDLPLDSISSVGMSILSSIIVATSSGKIRFFLITNRDEIHSAITKLLIDRQGKDKSAPTTLVKQEIPQSNADELAKYKDLLDKGVITQEEFNAKKKQILGL